MITLPLNKLPEDMQFKYRKLFNNAYNDLTSYEVSVTEGGVTTTTHPFANTAPFNDLSDYYAHMKDYITIGKPIYLLLPIDEEHFEIKANSREIKVPPTFSTCGGVTNDNLCEIITFTIDRYYDFVDLAGDKVHIVVEWKNAAGEEGVTGIDLIDLDTYFEEGLIRFGWPLDLSITKKEGPVTFAVKFFMISEETGKMTHVLNTLPATITIKKGLSVSDPSLYENPDTHTNILSDIASNSGKIANMPSGVSFTYYNWDEPGVIQNSKKLVGDTLDLIAEGYNADQREMEYEWYKAPWEWDLNDQTWKINVDEEVRITTGSTYTISDTYEKITSDRTTTPLPIKYILYKYNSDDNNFTRYVGNDWPDNNEDLYTRRSCLTFVKDMNADITGRYYVKVYNRVYNDDDELLGEAYKKSPFCYIYKPDQLQYVENKNLPERASISKGPVTLGVQFVESTKDPDVTHTWRRYSSLALAEEDIEDDGDFIKELPTGDNPNIVEIEIGETTPGEDLDFSSSREVNEVGYYKVLTINSLNRTTQSAMSNICKVTGEITAPTLITDNLTGSAFGFSNDGSKLQNIDSWISADSNKKPWISTTLQDFEVEGGDLFYLKITPAEKDELTTDGFLYKWSYSLQDSPTEIVLNNNTSVQGEVDKIVPKSVTIDDNSDTIVLRCVWKDDTYATINCEVINTLSGETKSANVQSVIIKNKKS